MGLRPPASVLFLGNLGRSIAGAKRVRVRSRPNPLSSPVCLMGRSWRRNSPKDHLSGRRLILGFTSNRNPATSIGRYMGRRWCGSRVISIRGALAFSPSLAAATTPSRTVALAPPPACLGRICSGKA